MTSAEASVNPLPNAVRYNDWRQVQLPPPDAFVPTMSVSVVVPCHRTPRATLEMTLAALEGQTYPRGLVEVVLVDDGSDPPLEPPPSALNIRLERQERRGFGLARARNTGARAASGDMLLFLDDDMLTEANWIAAHARWHHVVSDVLTMGLRAHAPVDGLSAERVRRRTGPIKEFFEGKPVDPPILPDFLKTSDLMLKADNLFWGVEGWGFGVGKAFYESLGGMDESFTRWGMEDMEFGYRAYTMGALLAPAAGAFAWHQGRWSDNREAKERDNLIQREKAAQLIAHRWFRSNRHGRVHRTPQFVVTLQTDGASAERVIEAVADLLADRVFDLTARVEAPGGADDETTERLRNEFGADPRVRLGAAGDALDEFPTASFHVSLPSSAAFAPNVVHRMRRRLGTAAVLSAPLPDGREASIARTWALHRARRAGGAPADYGDALTVAPAQLRIGSAPNGSGRGAARTEPVDHPTAWNRLADRARDIRGGSDALALLRGAASGAQWRAASLRRRLTRNR